MYFDNFIPVKSIYLYIKYEKNNINVTEITKVIKKALLQDVYFTAFIKIKLENELTTIKWITYIEKDIFPKKDKILVEKNDFKILEFIIATIIKKAPQV